jgi:hypothetical protein
VEKHITRRISSSRRKMKGLATPTRQHPRVWASPSVAELIILSLLDLTKKCTSHARMLDNQLWHEKNESFCSSLFETARTNPPITRVYSIKLHFLCINLLNGTFYVLATKSIILCNFIRFKQITDLQPIDGGLHLPALRWQKQSLFCRWTWPHMSAH